MTEASLADRRNITDQRGEHCRHCGKTIIKTPDGLWVAEPYADLSGYCSPRMDDERHQPDV